MRLLRLLASSPRSLVRAVALARHAGVPLHLKLIALAGIIAILSPLDIFGDIPILGLFDDATLIALLLAWFVRAAAPYGEQPARATVVVSRTSITR